MSEQSGTSFIPKRSPQKRTRSSSSRQVYVFTLISYTLIFAALLASLGVYVYLRVLERNEIAAASNLDTAIDSFNVSDMERVYEKDRRLRMATGRVDNLASVTSILSALEEATAKSVQFEDLSLIRDRDNSFKLEANIVTDNFDSALFQRGIYERQGAIKSFSANELAIQREARDQESSTNQIFEIEESVSLSGEMSFNVEDVLFDPNRPNEFIQSLDGTDESDENNNQSL